MFTIRWVEPAQAAYNHLKREAQASRTARKDKGRSESSKAEGLFKKVHKTIALLGQNPRHPGLQSHEFKSLDHPYDPKEKVFEAYAQHRTPGAYRLFWCYGPGPREITIIAVTPHP